MSRRFDHDWPHSVRISKMDSDALESLSETLEIPKSALLRLAFQNLAHEHLGAEHANPECARCINERFGIQR